MAAPAPSGGLAALPRGHRSERRTGAPLLIEIEGVELPGRRWGPDPDRPCHENIHVYLGRRDQPRDLVPGDAPAAVWRLEATVKPDGAGGIDVSGPLVQGKRGERYLALYWGDVADGSFALFRGAKLRFEDVEPATLRRAMYPGKRLLGRLRLTDARGAPRCASVRPPDIEWSVADLPAEPPSDGPATPQ